MINTQLLRKELEYITDHRDEWDQSTWLNPMSCRTKGCLFGNALTHAGEVEFDDLLTGEYQPTRGRDWVEAGAELFGLTEWQAVRLSDEDNSLYSLWALAHRFTGGEIEIPPNVSPAIRDL